jgi:hypothetical protein
MGLTGLWVEEVERRSGMGVRTVSAHERWRSSRWAQTGSSWGGLDRLRAGAWYCSIGPGPVKTFPISKLYMVVDKLKRNIFPLGKKFKFPSEFELKI